MSAKQAGAKDNPEGARLLRQVAFHIHRKEVPDEALNRCFEEEGRGGRHRQWRQPLQVLAEQGLVPALVSAGLVGDEAACLLAVIAADNDHRQLAAAFNALADYWEAS